MFDYIQQAIARDLCPKTPTHCPRMNQGGMKIYTTIDLRKQALARQAIVNHESLLAAQGGPGAAAAGLASINPANGHIEAIATSSDYNQTSFDYATDAYRQTGSAFKAFALMTLIHDYHGNPNDTYYTSRPLAAGWNPADPSWEVHTDDNTYHGSISIAHATTISDNTVYAQLASDLGYGKLDAMAHAMGITSPLDGNPSEVLGGLRYGVTPLQMADAYATIANGGSHVKATIIDKVVFPDGSVDDFGGPLRKRVFPTDEAYAADQVLKTVITGGTGTSAELRLSRRRQDRYRQQLRERLVRRLHAADGDRGVGRLPPGQHLDGRRLRRHAGGPDLARLHVHRVGRLLRRLSPPRQSRSRGPRSSATSP